jgi:DNA (cytosine-5)-methyltransferase 1
MMENVPRLMFHVTFKEFCAELECLGYKVCYDIKNAAQFGVPQRRKRLILLAGKGFNIPFARENHNIYTVRNAIGSLAEPEKSSDPLHNLRAKKRTLKIQKLISEIPKNGGSRSDLPRKRQLGCHKRSNGFWDVYGRMAWDEVAPTITSGCANPSKGRFLHPAEDRAITLREAALLQSFPGSYEFDLSAGKEAIALLIGNALPPEFIRRHAVEIRTALKNRM